jgi:F-type H+-transporting ATPase subunit epsilon
MMDNIHMSILTPERAIYEGESDAVYAMMHDGERGFLPGHAPLVGMLGIGMLRVLKDNVVTAFEVEGGFLEISKNRLIILAEDAMKKEELSEKQVRAELESVESALLTATPETRKKLELKKKKLASRLQVAIR